ncbi:hypothetical protein [Chitinophaga sp. Cy-1792]|uniref:hypothetical protein n=1 Tax=Chitinophaga sp. Cy-1792 TaxID=2608339 RepID=UPI00141F18C6|nr:hypothetical protein [Chitinophaga sp. Cy-1792]NIG54651.1 hypothetical protein [Chitinophaga sp. Cy-1792]
MNQYPEEITRFHHTLDSLQGINDVCSGIDNLEEIKKADLSNPAFAHLPAGTLLRTDGGLPGEVMLQFEFTIDKSSESLNSLEFISWFIRDQARSGTLIQLRTFALPPQTPDGIQLGQTLKFHIDLFIENAPASLQPILERVNNINNSMATFIRLYNIPTKSIKQ